MHADHERNIRTDLQLDVWQTNHTKVFSGSQQHVGLLRMLFRRFVDIHV